MTRYASLAWTFIKRLALLFCLNGFACYGGANVRYEAPPDAKYRIMGEGRLSVHELAAFLMQQNRSVSRSRARELARTYRSEAAKEGVNYDVAFAQMCLETGFLKFGGDTSSDQNNFAGIGADGNGPGDRFPSMKIGVRAHIQHLKAYASTRRLNQPKVDPRFDHVKHGSATTIFDLSQHWSVLPDYGQRIKTILDRMYAR